MNASSAINRDIRKQVASRAIIGIGATGYSLANYFKHNHIMFAAYDDKADIQQWAQFSDRFPDSQVFHGEFDFRQLAKHDEVFLSPGIPVRHPVLQNLGGSAVKIRNDVDLFRRLTQKPIVAISGSNGKSTVTTLVGLMAQNAGVRVAVGGNLDVGYQQGWGHPVMDLLHENNDLYVLELSSFQLESISSLGAEVAVLLNVSKDHLDYYPNFIEYTRAKQLIFNGAKKVVYNRDDVLTNPSKQQDGQQISFGLNAPRLGEWGIRQFGSKRFISFGDQPLISEQDIKLKGTHNWSNALAALSIATLLDLKLEPCLEVLKTFEGLTCRCEVVKEINNVCWINDSKATNIGACEAALRGLGNHQRSIILICGGDTKNQDFTQLEKSLSTHVKQILIIGEKTTYLQRVFNEMDGLAGVLISSVHNLEAAVSAANENAQAGNIVLLSPACASYDQFNNYIERGNQFVNLVKQL